MRTCIKTYRIGHEAIAVKIRENVREVTIEVRHGRLTLPAARIAIEAYACRQRTREGVPAPELEAR